MHFRHRPLSQLLSVVGCCPLAAALQEAPAEQPLRAELLALAALRAAQLQPALATCWRGDLWLQLLRHASPTVRWASARGAAALLSMSDAAAQQLMEQLLTQEQLLAAEFR